MIRFKKKIQPVHAADSEDSNTNNKKLDGQLIVFFVNIHFVWNSDEPRKFLNVDTVRSCVIPFSAYCITGFLLWLMLLSKCPQAWSRVLVRMGRKKLIFHLFEDKKENTILIAISRRRVSDHSCHRDSTPAGKAIANSMPCKWVSEFESISEN